MHYTGTAAPHRSQVYATFWLPLNGEYAPGNYPPYIGWNTVKKKAARFCDKEGRKLFDGHQPPVDVEMRLRRPERTGLGERHPRRHLPGPSRKETPESLTATGMTP
ncbi:hypothetical protein E1293_16760 [Actinomadura darangshiensis]|uniref:Uncharacterized protein n=1 Tax=Actinomadura darangshiensis TaxID=705336 RepID=A0A4R5B815_9ACTN|nr:hypothetical protein [Actinomadura darangshiensis]TDD82438.1 hypothetical protein E1293_16760 [Actinomadura darangshiensis]